jgi:DivIVA domain-containing protein
MMLTPKEVRNAELTVHRLREGYDTDEVDDLLDACADTIETLTKALKSIVTTKGNTNEEDSYAGKDGQSW